MMYVCQGYAKLRENHCFHCINISFLRLSGQNLLSYSSGGQSPKSRYSRPVHPWKVLEKGLFWGSFQASSRSLACGPITSVFTWLSFCVCPCGQISPFYKDTSHIGLQAYTVPTLCSRSVTPYVRLFATPWTVAHQVPLSMGFFR